MMSEDGCVVCGRELPDKREKVHRVCALVKFGEISKNQLNQHFEKEKQMSEKNLEAGADE